MTAAGVPLGDERRGIPGPEPERVLEGYAEATRIQASAAVVRRFQSAIADERAAEGGVTGRVRSLSLRLGIGRAARGIPSRPVPWLQGARFTFRLQGLALLLLLVLTLGLLAGGAGATIATLLHGPHRGSQAPGLQLVAPERMPTVTPSPAATIRVAPLAQRAPATTGKARKKAGIKRRSRVTWVSPACVADGGPHVSHRPCAF